MENDITNSYLKKYNYVFNLADNYYEFEYPSKYIWLALTAHAYIGNGGLRYLFENPPMNNLTYIEYVAAFEIVNCREIANAIKDFIKHASPFLPKNFYSSVYRKNKKISKDFYIYIDSLCDFFEPPQSSSCRDSLKTFDKIESIMFDCEINKQDVFTEKFVEYAISSENIWGLNSIGQS